jgi:hypothetical protein
MASKEASEALGRSLAGIQGVFLEKQAFFRHQIEPKRAVDLRKQLSFFTTLL